MAGTTSTPKRAPAKRAGGTKAARPAVQTAQTSPPAPVPVGEIPAELRGFYDQVEAIAVDTADVSLDMRTLTPQERERTQRREKLFSIDGVEHTIPVEFGPQLSLVFIDSIGQVGEDVALGRVLRAAMGKASWEALVAYEDLTGAQLKKILGITMEKIMGAVEVEKGKSRPGSDRSAG